MIDSANVGEVGGKVLDATPHAASGGGRVECVGGHANFLRKAGIGIFEIEIGNQVTAAGKCGGVPVVHAEQSGVMAAFLHAAHQFEEIRFGAAKRVVVLVAVKNSHALTPVVRFERETGPRTGEDFAGGHS